MGKRVVCVNPCAVRQVVEGEDGKIETTGMMIVPDPRGTFDEDEPLVRTYPWMFGTADELHEKRTEENERKSVPVGRGGAKK